MSRHVMRRDAAWVGAALWLVVSSPTFAETPAAPAAAMPFDIPYGPPIGLDRARHLVDMAVAEAARHGWKMNVAVVDASGDLVAFSRMDGAQLASIAVSQRKARTSARFRRETRVFADAMSKGHPEIATLDPDLVASPGGLPLIVDGRLVGAIGCSGGTGDQDAIVCKAGADSLRP